MNMPELQIGNVKLENDLILGPMAGVTDLPFRLLCKEQGAGLLCMEMVSAKGIMYNNKNTKFLLTIDEPCNYLVRIQTSSANRQNGSRSCRLIS